MVDSSLKINLNKINSLLKGRLKKMIIVKHPEKPTEINKIDDDDYMAEHDITGDIEISDIDGLQSQLDNIPVINPTSGTFQILQLIEKKTIATGSTTFEFTGLNGDADELYIMDFQLYFESDASASLKITPNGTETDDQKSKWLNWTNAWWGDDYKVLTISKTFDSLKTYISGHMRFFAKTGEWRRYHAQGYGSKYSEAHYGPFAVGGHWKNTSTNITSLKFDVVGSNTIRGVFTLYKLVTLTIS